MKSSCLHVLVFAAAAAGLITSTSAFAQSTLRYASSIEPPVLDPVVNMLGVVQEHGYLIYDQLFAYGCDGTPKPQMIDKYSVKTDDKGAVWTMSLRSGLKWHDGSPVTPKDVIASITRWSKTDLVGKKLASMGMQFAEVDAKTFTISMPVESPLLLQGLAKSTSPALFIMRASDASRAPTEPVTEFVGSGPFKFVPGEYAKGHKAIYEKNAEYVPRDAPADCLAGGKVAKVDRLEWLVMPDYSTAISALLGGEIDMYETPPLDLLPAIEADPNLKVHGINKLGKIGMLRMNAKSAMLAKPEARLALIKAFNQADAMAVVAGDQKYWRECYSYFACGGTNEYKESSKDKMAFEPAEAKRQLEAAGYKGEPIRMLVVGDDEVLRKIGTYAAEALRSAGLNVDMQVMDFAALLAKRRDTAAWEIFTTWNFGVELNHPFVSLALADGCSDGGYPGAACTEELNKVKDVWAREADPVKGAVLIKEMGRLADTVHVPYVSLGAFDQPIAYHNSLSGILETPLPVFWNIEKK
ncbi:ABC transporter substrate-binding protein [Mesorhizobium sp.]|uniref:ABC transporter substrate-binding protein n=1 Tax=Mesorhizobium sp. TaxID=1871066 RepID=UPI0025800A64|nr:ABC transporter substrate-binding protein [Mesorhizobium sp.]